jgi:acyl-CoA synthetase (AMP-forming)/AMP-acid ligase II/acyl carrier protein
MIDNLQKWWHALGSARNDFMRTPQGVLTNPDLATLVERICTRFDENKAIEGDRVLIVVDDERVAVAVFVAALFDGLVPVMLNPLSSSDRVESVWRSTGAKIAFVSASRQHDTWLGFLQHVNVISPQATNTTKFFKRREGAVESISLGLGLSQSLRTPRLPVTPDELAYILFTSGTTSSPSGVMITRGNLFANVATIAKVLKIDRTSVVFNDMVLAHADGIVQGPLLCLQSGATLFRAGGFSVDNIESWLESVRRENVTHFITVPTVWAIIDRYCRYDDYFSSDSFLYLSSTAARLPPSLWDRIEGRFKRPMISQYGLTETVACALYAGSPVRKGTLYAGGIPIDCEARVEVRPDCKPGEGELQLRGSNIFLGYWNNPDRTRETFTADGWMRTGDLATKDENGCFFITGRLKNIIMVGGFLIHPQEIDEALAMHPAVKSAVTISWADEMFGEIPVSLIESDDSSFTEQEATAFARAKLEPLKVPKHIRIVSAIPRGDAGKPNLTAVRELLKHTVESTLEIEHETASLESQLMQVAAKCFRYPIRDLRLQSGPKEIAGWDSFQHIAFLGALEDRFEIQIPTSSAAAIRNLQDALDVIEMCKKDVN